MSIVINKSKCVGCGQCSIVCPGSLIKMGEDRKAYIKYPKDCWDVHHVLRNVSLKLLRCILEQIWVVWEVR